MAQIIIGQIAEETDAGMIVQFADTFGTVIMRSVDTANEFTVGMYVLIWIFPSFQMCTILGQSPWLCAGSPREYDFTRGADDALPPMGRAALLRWLARMSTTPFINRGTINEAFDDGSYDVQIDGRYPIRARSIAPADLHLGDIVLVACAYDDWQLPFILDVIGTTNAVTSPPGPSTNPIDGWFKYNQSIFQQNSANSTLPSGVYDTTWQTGDNLSEDATITSGLSGAYKDAIVAFSNRIQRLVAWLPSVTGTLLGAVTVTSPRDPSHPNDPNDPYNIVMLSITPTVGLLFQVDQEFMVVQIVQVTSSGSIFQAPTIQVSVLRAQFGTSAATHTQGTICSFGLWAISPVKGTMLVAPVGAGDNFFQVYDPGGLVNTDTLQVDQELCNISSIDTTVLPNIIRLARGAHLTSDVPHSVGALVFKNNTGGVLAPSYQASPNANLVGLISYRASVGGRPLWFGFIYGGGAYQNDAHLNPQGCMMCIDIATGTVLFQVNGVYPITDITEGPNCIVTTQWNQIGSNPPPISIRCYAAGFKALTANITPTTYNGKIAWEQFQSGAPMSGTNAYASLNLILARKDSMMTYPDFDRFVVQYSNPAGSGDIGMVGISFGTGEVLWQQSTVPAGQTPFGVPGSGNAWDPGATNPNANSWVGCLTGKFENLVFPAAVVAVVTNGGAAAYFIGIFLADGSTAFEVGVNTTLTVAGIVTLAWNWQMNTPSSGTRFTVGGDNVGPAIGTSQIVGIGGTPTSADSWLGIPDAGDGGLPCDPVTWTPNGFGGYTGHPSTSAVAYHYNIGFMYNGLNYYTIVQPFDDFRPSTTWQYNLNGVGPPQLVTRLGPDGISTCQVFVPQLNPTAAWDPGPTPLTTNSTLYALILRLLTAAPGSDWIAYIGETYGVPAGTIPFPTATVPSPQWNSQSVFGPLSSPTLNTVGRDGTAFIANLPQNFLDNTYNSLVSRFGDSRPPALMGVDGTFRGRGMLAIGTQISNTTIVSLGGLSGTSSPATFTIGTSAGYDALLPLANCKIVVTDPSATSGETMTVTAITPAGSPANATVTATRSHPVAHTGAGTVTFSPTFGFGGTGPSVYPFSGFTSYTMTGSPRPSSHADITMQPAYPEYYMQTMLYNSAFYVTSASPTGGAYIRRIL